MGVVITIGFIDERNWMHESAEANDIFVASWDLRPRVCNSFSSLVCCESPQTSPEKVFLGRLCKSDPGSVQEENFLFLCA